MKYESSEIINLEYRLTIHTMTYMNKHKVGPLKAGLALKVGERSIRDLFARNGVKKVNGKYQKVK